MEEIIKIEAEWDVDNATFLTKELYKLVASRKIKFEVKARDGSVITDFFISVISSFGGNVLYDLIKILFKRLRDEKLLRGRDVKPVKVKSTHDEFIITGDEKSKLPKDLEHIITGERFRY